MNGFIEKRLQAVEAAVLESTAQEDAYIIFEEHPDGTCVLDGVPFATRSELLSTYERERKCRVAGYIILGDPPGETDDEEDSTTSDS